MKLLAPSDSSAATARPGSYLFAVPGRDISIYLSLDVIDRLLQDVMRGFGAVPKRGAEIGGILLGSSSEEAQRLVVRVDEYEMVPIEYKRGPSYLFSPADRAVFEETLARLRTAPAASSAGASAVPVGFFRSNTRDSAGLQGEDLEWLDHAFPSPEDVVLMIRPFATRVSTATFLVRENGKFPEGAPALEFPFRRKDLAPADDPGPIAVRGPEARTTAQSPPRRPRSELPIASVAARSAEQSVGARSAAQPDRAGSEYFERPPVHTAARTAPPAKASGPWVWVPLSFIFLLLGVLLGYQAALTMRPTSASGSADPYNLALTVSKEGEDLNVRWDRQAPAIRAARRGVLVIVDGSYNKTVELDPNQLQTGSVVYRYNSGDVRFRLEVYPRDRDVLTESVDWTK